MTLTKVLRSALALALVLAGLALGAPASTAAEGGTGVGVAGTLRDAAGRPLAGVTVMVHGAYHEAYGADWTDAEGRFSVTGLPAGRFVLELSHHTEGVERSFTPRITTPEVTTGTHDLGPLTVTPSIAYGTGTVAARFTSANLKKNHSRTVHAYLKDSKGRVVARGTARPGSLSLPDKVTFSALPAGTYRLYIVKSRLTVKVKVRAGVRSSLGTLKIPAKRATTPIRGTVRKANGTVFPLTAVVAYDARGELAGADYTNSSGRFSITGLPPGRYTVRVEGHGNQLPAKARKVTVRHGSRAVAADFRTRQGGTVKGVVRDASGAPLRGAGVRLVRPDGKDLLHVEQGPLATTTKAGKFTITGVRPGNYKVVVRDRRAGAGPDTYYRGTAFANSSSITVTAGKVRTLSAISFP